MQFLRQWLVRYFSDPQVVALALIIIFCTVLIHFFGRMLTPVIASIVIAYLLEGLVGMLERWQVPRLLGVVAVSCVFILALLLVLLILLPMLFEQLQRFFQEIPSLIAMGRAELMHFLERHPDLISRAQVQQITDLLSAGTAHLGQLVLSFSVASLRTLVTILIYLFLLPFLVFFLLKDKDAIVQWVARFLPTEHQLASKVWIEVNRQIGNYVRGKAWEILIVSTASYLAFAALNLKFALLLGFCVGISIIIPYLGTIAMTLPVALTAYLQWGVSSEAAYTLVVYATIHLLDGNVLAPVLFSEVVNLHPVAIIVAILFFGNLWGFWGLFFAIPLATLVQAVINVLSATRRSTKVGYEDLSEVQ